jgi:glucose-1-phosphate cytidylyltransferase
MKTYGTHGFDHFTLATGYLGDYIKNFFLHYAALNSDFEVNLATGETKSLQSGSRENWKVRLMDTGQETMTGGRLLRLEALLRPQGTFMLTYGDGVCDVDLTKLLRFHREHKKLVTITAVRPTARFGGLELQDGGQISAFREKLPTDEGWINGGFMVMEPGVFDYLENDGSILEREPMERLVKDGQLMAFQHEGFWQCMDTIRDRELLEHLWVEGKAPWKVWRS